MIPDVICYSAAIGSCSRGAEWQRALKLFHGLPSASVCPNIITYNEVLTCLHTAEEVKQMGYTLFKQAMQQGLYSRLLHRGARNLDVHEMSAGAAVLAVRWWLSEVRCSENRAPHCSPKSSFSYFSKKRHSIAYPILTVKPQF